MTISQKISDLSKAHTEIRAELDEINHKISNLESERSALLNSRPHTDDIVAAFISGLRRDEQDYARHLAQHLRSNFVEPLGAAAKLGAQPLDALAFDARSTTSAIAFFLRDKIEAEIPALVERLCPEAASGMRKADREEALRVNAASVAALRNQRDEINKAWTEAFK